MVGADRIPVGGRVVRDVMQRGCPRTAPDATLAAVLRRMLDESVHCLIVDLPGPPRGWGIITRTDIVEKAAALGPRTLNLSEHRARDVMSAPVYTAPPRLSVRDAIRRMKRLGVRQLPVLDGGDLVGLLTEDRILEEIGSRV